jgi:hypothetical protein
MHAQFRKADVVFMHPIWNMHQTPILASTFSIDEDPASWLCSNARTALPALGIILYIWFGGTLIRRETSESLISSKGANSK